MLDRADRGLGGWALPGRGELPEARSWLKQADAALGVSPDKLIGAIAYLVAACGALAEGHAAVVVQIIARARSGCSVPAWLDHGLNLVQSRAYVAAGDIQAALTAAERAGGEDSLEAAVTRRMLGWLPETATTHGACSHPRSRPTAARPTGYVCKRGWLMPGSATTAATARAVAGH